MKRIGLALLIIFLYGPIHISRADPIPATKELKDEMKRTEWLFKQREFTKKFFNSFVRRWFKIISLERVRGQIYINPTFSFYLSIAGYPEQGMVQISVRWSYYELSGIRHQYELLREWTINPSLDEKNWTVDEMVDEAIKKILSTVAVVIHRDQEALRI